MIFDGWREFNDCINVFRSDLLILPVNVICPLLTAAFTVGKSLVASVTPCIKALSGFTAGGGGGGGGGVVVKLLTTDFTPLIPWAVVPAIFLQASSFISPVNVATPS